MTKCFETRVLLTVTTGRLLTAPKGPRDNGIGDLYEILGWMTDDSPFTHQLPRFARECKPWLLRWFPELAGAEAVLDRLDEAMSPDSKLDEDTIDGWIDQAIRECGLKDAYDVPRIPADGHERKHPYDELVAMVGGADDQPEEPQ